MGGRFMEDFIWAVRPFPAESLWLITVKPTQTSSHYTTFFFLITSAAL